MRKPPSRFHLSRRWAPYRRHFFPLPAQIERRRWGLRERLPWQNPRIPDTPKRLRK